MRKRVQLLSQSCWKNRARNMDLPWHGRFSPDIKGLRWWRKGGSRSTAADVRLRGQASALKSCGLDWTA